MKIFPSHFFGLSARLQSAAEAAKKIPEKNAKKILTWMLRCATRSLFAF